MSSVPGVIGSERPQESSLLLLPPAKAQQKVEQQEAAEPSEQRDISSSDEAVVDYSGEYDEEEEEEEEEVVMDEEEMLRMLDQMEPPLSVCQRLLKADGDDDDCGDRWLVLSASQRASLRERGFVVLDGLAPAGLAAEAYEEATARAASGSLTPAHGGSTSSTSGGVIGPANTEGDRMINEEGQQGEDAAAAAAATGGAGLTGYVKSVRDDLTAFVSSEREAAACGAEGGAVGRTLAILARLGSDLGRMVRLRGGVEHQLAVYPAGIDARYERHRDAYPDDGEDDDSHGDDDDGGHDSSTADGEGGVDGGGSGSVSFRRITAICYLRGSGNPWEAPDGGALRLYPPAITASTNEHDEVGSSDNGVVFKFTSQLGLSDQDSQQQQQQQSTPASGIGGGGVKEDNGQGSNNSRVFLSSACDGGAEHDSKNARRGGGGGAGAGAGTGDSGGGGDFAGDSGGGDAGDADGGDSGPGDGTRGGEVQEESFVDVAPLSGRAVVFFSGAVEHEVLPVTGASPRAALTTWFH